MAQKESVALCDEFEFSCSICQAHFKLTWYEIKGLLNPYHSVPCIHCQQALALSNKERRSLARYLGKAAGLAKTLLFIVIPYFLLSIMIIWRYGGIISGLFVLLGFALFMLLRIMLNKPVKRSYQLQPVKDDPL